MPQSEERSWIDTDVLVPLGLDDYVVDSDDHYSPIAPRTARDPAVSAL